MFRCSIKMKAWGCIQILYHNAPQRKLLVLRKHLALFGVNNNAVDRLIQGNVTVFLLIFTRESPTQPIGKQFRQCLLSPFMLRIFYTASHNTVFRL